MTGRTARVVLIFSAFVVGLAAIFAAATVLIGNADTPARQVAVGGPFRLIDGNGKVVTDQDFKGKPFLVFFGFTHCPEVCPTTLFELSEILRKLGPDAERVRVVFITVDPERDTPALLKSYMAGFDPSFVALRGTPEQTQAVAKEFKVFYAKVPGKEPGSYTMDHSAGSYVFDTNGRIRLFERYQTPPQALAEDLKRLL